MTKHLSEAELVDYAEGVLPRARAAHGDGCDACRARAVSMRQVLLSLADTRGADVPEPSPLFWDHFSRRVHDAVQDVPPHGLRYSWFRAPWIGWMSATALVVAVAVIFWPQQAPNGGAAPGTADAVPHAVTAAPGDAPVEVDDDEDWALVRVVADDLNWDDAPAAGITARPGSAELVALEMSPAERQELARLIEDEMKRTGA